jgi:hypothetical protein
MGAGIAKQIRGRYPNVYTVFMDTFTAGENKLGNIDVVYVQKERRFIINMYSQGDYKQRGVRHTNYYAFRECLKEIKLELQEYLKWHNPNEDI